MKNIISLLLIFSLASTTFCLNTPSIFIDKSKDFLVDRILEAIDTLYFRDRREKILFLEEEIKLCRHEHVREEKIKELIFLLDRSRLEYEILYCIEQDFDRIMLEFSKHLIRVERFFGQFAFDKINEFTPFPYRDGEDLEEDRHGKEKEKDIHANSPECEIMRIISWLHIAYLVNAPVRDNEITEFSPLQCRAMLSMK